MSEKKQEQLKRFLNAIEPLEDEASERIVTLAEGMAIQKSLAGKKEGVTTEEN